MSDLISRESAIVRVSKVIWDDLVAHDVKEVLKALPSAVVHCKDCKHNAHIPQRYADNILWSCWDVDPDGYCSKAERREA